MKNNIRIPTAAQARESMSVYAEEACNKAWTDILTTVYHAIDGAIRECKFQTSILESQMQGVPIRMVLQKLSPILESMGYSVELGKYGGTIVISWNKKGDTNESK